MRRGRCSTSTCRCRAVAPFVSARAFAPPVFLRFSVLAFSPFTACVLSCSAALAAPLLVTPDVASRFLFSVGTLPAGETHVAISRTLGANLLLGATVAAVLSRAAKNGDLSDPRRSPLQIGLAAAGLGVGALTLSTSGGIRGVSKTLSKEGSIVACAASALGAAVPLAALLSKPKARSALVDRVRETAGKLVSGIANPKGRGLRSIAYGVIAPLLLAAGAFDALAPTETLTKCLGTLVARPSNTFLTRCAGAVLAGVGPAVALSLQASSEEQELERTGNQTLNAGLVGTAVAHLAAVGSLPWAGYTAADAVVGLWVATLATAASGIVAK